MLNSAGTILSVIQISPKKKLLTSFAVTLSFFIIDYANEYSAFHMR